MRDDWINNLLLFILLLLSLYGIWELYKIASIIRQYNADLQTRVETTEELVQSHLTKGLAKKAFTPQEPPPCK